MLEASRNIGYNGHCRFNCSLIWGNNPLSIMGAEAYVFSITKLVVSGNPVISSIRRICSKFNWKRFLAKYLYGIDGGEKMDLIRAFNVTL